MLCDFGKQKMPALDMNLSPSTFLEVLLSDIGAMRSEEQREKRSIHMLLERAFIMGSRRPFDS